MNSNLCEKFFAILADRNRLSILNLILEKDLTVNEISKNLNLEQSLVSHHLKSLKEHGFVDYKIEGKTRLYSVNKETMRPLMDIMRAHVSKFCGFACQYKVDEWSKTEPIKAINHETEVVMEKIKILTKYSRKKLKSKKELIEASDFFNNTLTNHFKEEELTLFRIMEKKGSKKIVDELLQEHNKMRRQFSELKYAVASYSNDPSRLKKITNEIVVIIQSHIEKEENILIPMAKKILTKVELQSIKKGLEA